MNLFESQIEKLNLSPTAKNCVIELRKVCLEATEDEAMNKIARDFKVGEKTTNDDAAMQAIQDTIKLAERELSKEDYDLSAPGKALMNKIQQKYRNEIANKFGEKWGEQLITQAQKYISKKFIE